MVPFRAAAFTFMALKCHPYTGAKEGLTPKTLGEQTAVHSSWSVSVISPARAPQLRHQLSPPAFSATPTRYCSIKRRTSKQPPTAGRLHALRTRVRPETEGARGQRVRTIPRGGGTGRRAHPSAVMAVRSDNGGEFSEEAITRVSGNSAASVGYQTRVSPQETSLKYDGEAERVSARISDAALAGRIQSTELQAGAPKYPLLLAEAVSSACRVLIPYPYRNHIQP